MKLINLFHILFVAPLLVYIGVTGANTPDIVFKFLAILGLFVFIYHLYKLYVSVT